MELRIGVDLDGVVYDFVDALRGYLVKNYGYRAEQLPSPTKWAFFQEWGLTEDNFLRLCHEATDAEWLFRVGNPVPGSVEAIRYLRSQGHSIHICTSRNFGFKSEYMTRVWLDQHDVPRQSLTFAHDKSILDVDVFIDDKPSNVDHLVENGVCAYLLKDPCCPDRRDTDGHPRLVESWEAFVNLIEAAEELAA